MQGGETDIFEEEVESVCKNLLCDLNKKRKEQTETETDKDRQTEQKTKGMRRQ
jgi:hypothetical protein